jgi:hypothetical protein
VSAADLLRCASERGLALWVRSEDRILIRGQAEVVESLKPQLLAQKPEIIALLRERDPLGGHAFTDHGYLCRRCKGLGPVAVIDGEITCKFCVLAEAERLAMQGNV